MEAYDENLSLNVSLSQVLDAMILEKERTEVVIDFLDMHRRDVYSMFRESIYSNRFLFFDRLIGLDYEYVRKYFDILMILPEGHVVMWQCLISKDIDDTTKTRLRNDFRKGLNGSQTRHPYSSRRLSFTQQLEREILSHHFDLDTARFLVENNDIGRYIDDGFMCLDGLIKYRLIEEYDFFENLSDQSKLKLIYMYPCEKLLIQMIESGEEVDVQYEMFKSINKNGYKDSRSIETNNLVYPESLIDRSLRGEAANPYFIIDMLIDHTSRNCFLSWYKERKEDIDEIIRISPLVEKIIDKSPEVFEYPYGKD